MVDTKISNLTAFTTPTDDDVFPAVDGTTTKKITWADFKTALEAQLAISSGYPFDARLTLETGIPVSITDQADKVHVFLTKHKGDEIAVYDGVSAWDILTLGADLDLDVTAFTASKPYDIWVYNNAGSLAFDSTVWTNATTRATALATQNGVLVKTGATTRRYVGTIYMDAASKCHDTVLKRFVWNYYNQEPKKLYAYEATDNWAYTTATYRPANNSTANRVEVVIGVVRKPIKLTISVASTNGTDNVKRYAGVGLDVTNANNCELKAWLTPSGSSYHSVVAFFENVLSVGYHYLQWVEYSEAAGATTWYGDAGVPNDVQSGMVGEIWV